VDIVISQDIETQTSNSICGTVTRKITGEVEANSGDSYSNGDNGEGDGNGSGSWNGHGDGDGDGDGGKQNCSFVRR
jgi:hypothetical protein